MHATTPDAVAAEHGLSSIERLVEEGDFHLAKVAVETFGPGLARIVDDAQAKRLTTVVAELEAQETEMATGGVRL